MTENMAARGEGLAGLKLCPSCQAADNNPYTDANGVAMRACGRCMIQWRAALEAAVPAGTAHERELLQAVLNCETHHDERGHAYLKVPARSLNDLAAVIAAALATPSPQAPAEQSSAFSTTSAREQSSATASNGPSVELCGQSMSRPDVPVEQSMICNARKGHAGVHSYTTYWQPPMNWSPEQFPVQPSITQRGTQSDSPVQRESSNGPDSTSAAATQEQPAGSRATHIATVVYRDGQEPIVEPGSPRKVGEDGASERVMRTALLAIVNMAHRAWEDKASVETMFRLIGKRAKGALELARPSSVPVGEQKQEEGV